MPFRKYRLGPCVQARVDRHKSWNTACNARALKTSHVTAPFLSYLADRMLARSATPRCETYQRRPQPRFAAGGKRHGRVRYTRARFKHQAGEPGDRNARPAALVDQHERLIGDVDLAAFQKQDRGALPDRTRLQWNVGHVKLPLFVWAADAFTVPPRARGRALVDL